MDEIFLDKFEGFLTFIIPCMEFIHSQKHEDRLASGSECGDEPVDVM